MPIKKRRKARTKFDPELKGIILNDRFLINRLQKKVVDLEAFCLQQQRKYNDMQEKIVRLLSPEQIEAAAICGCTPEVYALEWIQLCKEYVQKFAPSYMGNLINRKDFTND